MRFEKARVVMEGHFLVASGISDVKPFGKSRLGPAKKAIKGQETRDRRIPNFM